MKYQPKHRKLRGRAALEQEAHEQAKQMVALGYSYNRELLTARLERGLKV